MERENNRDYLERRLREVAQSAKQATDPKARKRYEELAVLYRERLDRLLSDEQDYHSSGWVTD
ncbi:MAG: hypothetical protein ABI667_08340 [Sphingomicrobium sp.]